MPSLVASERVRLCAGNNADLCQAIFKVHGLSDRRSCSAWSSDEQAPLYYPNAATLDADDVPIQLAEITRLRSVLAASFSVKDGFCRLDLRPLGFSQLFEASWIWMDLSRPTTTPSGWERVRDAASLEMWELAWTGGAGRSSGRLFPTAVLADPAIAILGRRTADGFTAGCIANRSELVIGLSNVFATDGNPTYRDAVRAAANTFAESRALVGYERGGGLDDALTCGFQTTGTLRVWIRDSQGKEE
ncbi:hypothetical protein [Mesorhizobium sp. WSM3873]|uniref:hypothetical protein n=1 Tax=Mesorhizobium sp. WSM3873 TaxID=1854056 RepID=UPI0008023D4A|nr:hypothetical protein [Mesorhizobium sp. WSM3873]OBQ84112.1 hypothetical protein A9K71_22550 [Mesorhizobium sp. WSM3873]